MTTPTHVTIPSTVELRDPDRRLTKDRAVTFVWDLGADPDGGTRQVILTVDHHMNSRGGSFIAMLLNQTEDGVVRRMGAITDWTKLAAQPVSRYSKRRLDEFAEQTLDTLRTRYRQDDSQGLLVRRHFEVQQ